MIKNIKNTKVADTIFIDTSCLKQIDCQFLVSTLDPHLHRIHMYGGRIATYSPLNACIEPQVKDAYKERKMRGKRPSNGEFRLTVTFSYETKDVLEEAKCTLCAIRLSSHFGF